MLFKKKVNIRDEMFDTMLDLHQSTIETVETLVQEAKHEIMDMLFAVALGGGITTKKLAEKFDPKGLADYAKQLIVDVDKRITEVTKKAKKPVSKRVK